MQALLLPKKRTPAETRKMLKALLDMLDAEREWTPDGLEQLFRDFTEKLGWKTRELFMTVRVAVTGRKASPPLFETLAVLGKLPPAVLLSGVENNDAFDPGAEFEVIVPASFALTGLSYEAEETKLPGGGRAFRFRRTDFLPDRDLCVAWRKRPE